MNKLISDTISFLRFPLCCAVVLHHSGVPHYDRTADCVAQFEPLFRKFMYTGPTNLAVPIFFAISGFLFFHNVEEFGIIGGGGRMYLKKLKTRVFSLLIPYLFWNFLVFIRELISQTFFSELMAGNKKPYVDYTLYDYFDAFFSISREMPLDYPLWFIKDLMVVVVLTPIIYYLLKHFHPYFLTVFSLLYILAPSIDIPLPFCSSILFFSLGACLSIKKIDFLPQLISKRWLLLFIYIIFISLWMLTNNHIIHNLARLIGIPFVVAFASYGVQLGSLHANKFLASSSFFIYAYHGYYILMINKYIGRMLPVQNDVTLILTYLLTTVLIVCLGLLFYYLLRKYLPKFTAIICGSR